MSTHISLVPMLSHFGRIGLLGQRCLSTAAARIPWSEEAVSRDRFGSANGIEPLSSFVGKKLGRGFRRIRE